MVGKSTIDAVVIGVSAGGLAALSQLLPSLKKDFPASVVVVQHQRSDADSFMAEHLDKLSRLKVVEAEDKELLQPGTVYIAPANYHLLVERECSLALSVDERVNYSRPSIDVLFESAAKVFFHHLVGVVLTGANDDGTKGLGWIKKMGGLVIVQNPETAEVDIMPKSALARVDADYILDIEEIAACLNKLVIG